MDGNTLEMDPKTAEKMRQEEVYKRAMASLDRKRQEKEGEGLTIMFAAGAFQETIGEDKIGGKAVKFAKLFLVLFAGISINLLFYTQVLS